MLTLLVVFIWRNCHQEKSQIINQDYYLITNQIQKMNKMVVLEQKFSSFQTHKDAAFQVGGYDFLPKEMVLYTTAKAQISYDLNKMKIEVDSIDKKLIIKELPKAEIQIFPEANIHFMDDYILNRYDGATLKSVINSAKQNMVKSIDRKMLEQKGREQLMKNLNDIFILAKALHYTIEDKTNQLTPILN